MPGPFPERNNSLMNNSFRDYFRCPSNAIRFAVRNGLSENAGFFQFGKGVVGYGKYSQYQPSTTAGGNLPDATKDVKLESGTVCLPFHLDEVIDNLRFERYTEERQYGSSSDGPISSLYYAIRPILPVAIRRHLQRVYLSNWKKIAFPQWPVDHTVDSIMRGALQLLLRAEQLEKIPFIWFWPDGASSSITMTHDVETTAGRDYCGSVMEINESFGMSASFQIIPETRYEVSEKFLESIRNRGFEVNVQDLNHDGRLYNERNEFKRRATKINEYGRLFKATGFRSAILYRRQEWYSDLEFSYDMSVPSSGHLEPQRGGCCTVMPYFVGKLLEVPVTTTQDYSLFNYLRSFSIDLWKQQIELILEQNGLISFIVHPDYIMKTREAGIYQELLGHLASVRAKKNAWTATPGEIDRWWRQRSKMELVHDGDNWKIEGAGSERARVAYASEKEGKLVFTMQNALEGQPSANLLEQP